MDTAAQLVLQPMMQVEIDLFSGRPNPHWQLAPSELAELESRLVTLPAAASAALPDGLGYRGLHLGPVPARQMAHEPPWLNPIVALEVGGGVIQATRRNGATLHWLDSGRSLECWLLTLARGRVEEPLRQLALADLGEACS
jgi:hypothetical protein